MCFSPPALPSRFCWWIMQWYCSHSGDLTHALLVKKRLCTVFMAIEGVSSVTMPSKFCSEDYIVMLEWHAFSLEIQKLFKHFKIRCYATCKDHRWLISGQWTVNTLVEYLGKLSFNIFWMSTIRFVLSFGSNRRLRTFSLSLYYKGLVKPQVNKVKQNLLR